MDKPLAGTIIAAIVAPIIVMRISSSPTPTPTRMSPSATPTPMPTAPYPPVGWKLALSDPLDKPLYWQNGSNTDGTSCQFIDGAYHIILPKAGNSFCAEPSNMFSDLAIEVTMTIIDGDCGGIWFRANGPAYLFQVCQDRRYSLFCFCLQGIQTLSNSVSQAIHSGRNQSNLIAVVAIGSHYDLYVNRERIDSISNSALSSGRINFGAAGSDPTEVAFANAKVWTP
jgi:hypothetical protein